MQALLYGILVTALDHLKVIEEEKGMLPALDLVNVTLILCCQRCAQK